MNQDTFQKAQELQSNIHQTKSAIDRIENDERGCNGPALNFVLFDDQDKEAIKKTVLRMLKLRLAKYKKEFEKLK